MRNKYLRIIILAWIVLGCAYTLYQVFLPHRDVINTEAEASLSIESFVHEYLDDKPASNLKYLSSDGDSKILLLEGNLEKIKSSGDGRVIVILTADSIPVGIQCLFAEGKSPSSLEIGSTIKIKGVLRAGPGYDEDLEMYEPGYLEECIEIK